jgi:hypothetical protein
MYIHALSENTPMIRIASTAGARVVRHGCESEAYLQLDSPTLRSRFSEYVEQNVAQVDYHIKSRTRRPSSFSANMNKARPIALTNHEKQVIAGTTRLRGTPGLTQSLLQLPCGKTA